MLELQMKCDAQMAHLKYNTKCRVAYNQVKRGETKVQTGDVPHLVKIRGTSLGEPGVRVLVFKFSMCLYAQNCSFNQMIYTTLTTLPFILKSFNCANNSRALF